MQGLIASLTLDYSERGPTEWKHRIDNIDDFPSDFNVIATHISSDLIGFKEVQDFYVQLLDNFLFQIDIVQVIQWLKEVYFPPVISRGFIRRLFNLKSLLDSLSMNDRNDVFQWNYALIKNTYYQPSLEPNIIKEELTKSKLSALLWNFIENAIVNQDVTTPIPYWIEILQFLSKVKPILLIQYLNNLDRTYLQPNYLRFFQTLYFVKDWTPASDDAQQCKNRFLQALHPIVFQVFFASETCWYDHPDEPCESCVTNAYLFPIQNQYRCTAICEHAVRKIPHTNVYSSQTQCLRFAQPDSIFCKQHMNSPTKKSFKRQCKDNCPSSDKKKSYKEDPYEELSSNILRYPTTHRPVTDMPHLVQGNIGSGTFGPFPEGYYLPVSRLDNLYYSGKHPEEDKLYCGKFFFYERDSSVYLYLGKSLFVATKVEAYMKLQYLSRSGKQSFRSQNKKAFQKAFDFTKAPDVNDSKFFANNQYDASVLDDFPSKTISTLLHSCMADEFFEEYDNWLHFHFQTPFLTLEDSFDCEYDFCLPVFYPTMEPDPPISYSLVGTFDYLDQPICYLAKSLGFDTIVFQHEIGGHDCVTEIMHTGDFRKNLFYITNVPSFVREQVVLPKIWFPKDDGILHINTHQEKKYDFVDPIWVFEDFHRVPIAKLNGVGYVKEYGYNFMPRKLPKKRIYMHTGS